MPAVRKRRLDISTADVSFSTEVCCFFLGVFCCCFKFKEGLYIKAFCLQASKQSKQSTQRLWSIKCSLLSIQAALHLVAQSPQPLHLLVSIRILNSENRLKNPNTVPTGQIVLHHVRPCFQASTMMIPNVTIAMTKD